MKRLLVISGGAILIALGIGLLDFDIGSASALADGGNSQSHQRSPSTSQVRPPAKGPTNAEAKAAQESGCPGKKVRHIDNEHAHAPKLEPTQPIEFTVHETSSVLNFGSKRNTRADYVVLKASEPIPGDIYSSDFEIDSLEPLRRIGEASLESVHLKSPTFTPPHFFNHRKEIGFDFCVSTKGGKPGTYTGQFQFIGPGSIVTATLTQTVQLKAENDTFLKALIGVIVLALILLAVNHLILPANPQHWKEWAARIILIVVSLAAAVSAMLIAWSQNPTWGENLWVAIGALVATAFGAAGLGSTLSAAAGQIKSPPDDPTTPNP
jgi:hypothetical protein